MSLRTDSLPSHLRFDSPQALRLLRYGLVLLISLGVALGAVLWNDRQGRLRHGQQQALSVASGAERELARELAGIERELAALAADLPQTPSLLDRRVARLQQRNPDLRNVAVSASLPAIPGLQATGLSPERSAGRMRIGHPRQSAGLGWVLPLALSVPARRMPADAAADTGQAAWVTAALPLRVLERLAADLDLGSDGIANIIHIDGWMVVRSRDQTRWTGTPLQDTVLFREHLGLERSSVFDLTSPLDGTARIVASRRLPEYPLLVAVGISRKDAMLGWGTFAVTASLLGALLALLWGVLLWVMLRSRGRQQELTDSLQRRTERLSEARRIANMGDWTWELDTGLVTWSEEIYRIHGLPVRVEPFPIEDVAPLIHAEDRERVQQHMGQMLEDDEPSETHYRILRADGAVRCVYARAQWSERAPGRRVLRGIQQDVTELTETRERLRQAQDEYRFMFEHNPLPMWVFDRETLGFLAANDAMLDHYGYTREQLLAGGMLDILLPGDAENIRASVRLASTERAQGRIWTHLRHGGSPLRAAIHTHDIDFHGRAARLVMALDVTDQEHSEQRFQLVARATSDAVYDLDLQTGVLWWSDTFYSLFGYAPEQVPPTLQGWERLIHPEDLARTNASLQAAIADPAVNEWEAEYRFALSDDGYADVLDRGFLKRDDQGRAIRIVGGMLDLTQKHRDQSDLRLLRRAVDSTENGVVISDARLPDMPVVYINPAFERITGYTAVEILGRNCRFLQGDDGDQLGRVEVNRAIAAGREARVLLRNYRKDGALFWNDLHLNPVRDESGVITHFVGVQNDVTERHRYQEQIAYRALHDELTGLPNRTLLLDRLQHAIASAARSGASIGVAFVDLDHFKLVNDSLGHGAGDVALRSVATRLASCVRDSDTVSRFGGDEFVLVITERADSSGIQLVIQRVEAAFAEPLDIGGALHYLTCSIGYCCFPKHGDDAELLLMHADIAMYEAKQAGRNRVVEYRSEFNAVVSERLHLVSRLREALSHEEFVLHFQPLFRADGAPSGMEALVRWQHPGHGLLPPGRFIGACESSGLIVQLGRWILHEAVRHHALLVAHGLGHLTISINVSALQFQSGLLDDVRAAMQGQTLPKGSLEIELTESAVMADPEAAIAIMNQLTALGISVAVDDFGTGYSSLAYLKRLPIERLKIDQSFVRDLGHDSDDEAICATIIALARSLELRTVAEGVETEEQRNWLLAHGCDELQGYLLARPAPFEDIMALLAPHAALASRPVD